LTLANALWTLTEHAPQVMAFTLISVFTSLAKEKATKRSERNTNAMKLRERPSPSFSLSPERSVPQSGFVCLRDHHNRLRLVRQRLAAIQRGSIFGEVLLNSVEDWLEIGIESIEFVFSVPFRFHKSAIQQTGQIV
jgi:hypothetical protein